MLRRGLLVLAVVLFTGETWAAGPQAIFRNLKVSLDLDMAQGNQGIRSLPKPAAGGLFAMQVFVEDAAMMPTLGFTFDFTFSSRLDFSDYLAIGDGEAFDGSEMACRQKRIPSIPTWRRRASLSWRGST